MRARVLRARRTRASFLFMVYLLLLLGFFNHDALVVIAHALALVRLRRTVSSDLRSHLPDLLLVDALDQDLGLLRGLDGDALRGLVDHRVREAERQVHLVTGRRGAVTHADQGQLALEALG